MKRGVIVSIDTKHAVVMTQDGQFVRAPLQGSPQIGEEITFEEEHLRPRRINRTIYRYAGAAAMFCLLLFAGLAYSLQGTNPVVAYLTMDINPSIEIGVDKREKVRELRALNKDGEKIIEGLSYKGKKVDKVAASILEEASKAHYLDSSHKDIFITSMLLDGQKKLDLDFESVMTKKLDRKLQNWLTEHASTTKNVSITTLSIPAEMRAEADANGISAGKLAAYLVAKSEGYDLTLDKVKDQSIDSIMKPVGGVEKIVESKDGSSTKQKLQQLLAKEMEERGEEKPKPTSSVGDGSTEQPTKNPTLPPTMNPTLKPKPTQKPTSKPSKHQGKDDRNDDDDDENDNDDNDDDDRDDNDDNDEDDHNNDRDRDWHKEIDGGKGKDRDKDKEKQNKPVMPTAKPKDWSKETKDDDDRDEDRDNERDDDRDDDHDDDDRENETKNDNDRGGNRGDSERNDDQDDDDNHERDEEHKDRESDGDDEREHSRNDEREHDQKGNDNEDDDDN
ncbi:anti-sigma factor domain-containing protein [Paenibacillus sp. GSMTC-2017]|uniref:anti-sigma-I factor RsgI family protein n=1 Tax=Paenibacillus sp. GSMTC-2017 TaxID=2794350 RepID=UPI0018D91D91|nr:anti-sigma factor domain-containing protein [Paenibacillus sp. GSMTC-2017]MBH5317371.1 anti-sigma factor domain-containing protein [Paenibacillus sp. GSMTC-2017]